MYYYRLYGLRVISDLEFPQLVKESEGMEVASEVYIRNADIPEQILSETDKQYEFGEHFSWLTNMTCWIVVENGTTISYRLKDGAESKRLLNYILGFGMSMLALQRGALAIHCSAVADEKGAVLIAGESGAGKSTLTTAFLQKGYRLMADDMAYVESRGDGEVLAKPAFPYQKLCRDVALAKGYNLDDLIYINESKDKFLVPFDGEFRLEAVPIKAFIMLGVTNETDVVTQEITGLGRFYIYANNLFLRHLLEQDKYSPGIGQKCLEMAAVVPTYFIGRPLLEDTAQQIVAEAFDFISNL